MVTGSFIMQGHSGFKAPFGHVGGGESSFDAGK
jgi:hypothetical protein